MDLDGLDPGEVDHVDGLDREREVPSRARLSGLGIFAETRDHPAPAFVDDVEAAGEPYDEHQQNEEPNAAERKARARRLADIALVRLTATEQLVDPAVDVAPDLVQIGRPGAAALTPLRIVKRHES